jgi:hypothetical protein
VENFDILAAANDIVGDCGFATTSSDPNVIQSLTPKYGPTGAELAAQLYEVFDNFTREHCDDDGVKPYNFIQGVAGFIRIMGLHYAMATNPDASDSQNQLDATIAIAGTYLLAIDPDANSKDED